MSDNKQDTFLIHEQLAKLATFSASPNPSVTRVVFSDEDMTARNYFQQLCEDLNLEVTVDALGNTFARWVGEDPSLPAVATGSHIDAIPDAGMYDGTVGVIGGIEAIRLLKKQGMQPKRSIDVILFTSEEPTRYGIGCLGSRMMCGQLTPEKAASFKDQQDVTLTEILARRQFPGDLADVKMTHGHYHSFVEYHIEQGPILEAENLDIGIVTKIAAPSALRVSLTGKGGHAGCVMMPDRFDAGTAAAEISLAVERIARESASDDTVATTGVFDIKPNAINSIPKEAYLEIDLRDTNLEVRDACLENIQQEIKDICERRQIKADVSLINKDTPAICDASIIDSIEHACKKQNYSYKKMISYAYHDTLFMNQICPTSMIFIPCKGGVSHRADEYSSPEQIEKGVMVLAETLKALVS